MGSCCTRLWNASAEKGTTAFERVFLGQMPWSSEESIRVIAELQEGERDFTVDEVRANVKLALQEHPRLSEVISEAGLWTKVDVDMDFHIVSLPAEADISHGPTCAEEPSALRTALTNMPALIQQDGRPLWQVIITPRKIVVDMHHGLVDGVGLAVIAASILHGKTMDQINAEMCAKSNVPEPAFCTKVLEFLKGCVLISWYLSAPSFALVDPDPKSAIFATGQPAKKQSRLMHLGPYDLESLKRASKGKGTLNSVLTHTIAQGLHSYCRSEDGKDATLPRRIVVPVSFKKPHADDPSYMQANNDFSSIIVPCPPPGPLPKSLPQVSLGEASAARTAQVVLSTLPLPVIQWLYRTSSRLFSFCLSNVNASWAGPQFVSCSSTSMTAQQPRRIRVYGYGAPPADISLFVLVNSHGQDVHINLTVGCYIRDAAVLSRAIHSEVCNLISASPEGASSPLLP